MFAKREKVRCSKHKQIHYGITPIVGEGEIVVPLKPKSRACDVLGYVKWKCPSVPKKSWDEILNAIDALHSDPEAGAFPKSSEDLEFPTWINKSVISSIL